MRMTIKRTLSIIMAVVLTTAIFVFPLPEPVKAEENIIEIKTIADMTAFAEAVAAGNDYKGYTIKLKKNLKYDGTPGNFTTIGGSSSKRSFKGIFDGQNHTISGINVNSDDAVYGLFRRVEYATVKNLTLKDCTFVGAGSDVAALCADAFYSDINNIHIEGGRVENTKSFAAGIVANAYSTTIRNSSNTSTVLGKAKVGVSGIVKSASDTTITNCFNGGEIISTSEADPAKIKTFGIAWSGATGIFNCYNSGSATIGITGKAANVNNCYSVSVGEASPFGTGMDIRDCKIMTLDEMTTNDFLQELNSYADTSTKLKYYQFKDGYPYPVIKKTSDKQSITVNVASKKYKAKTLAKKQKSFSIGAKSKTSRTYGVITGPSYITVSKTGKVTVKKGTPAGVYTVRIYAKATAKYKSATKDITITVVK